MKPLISILLGIVVASSSLCSWSAVDDSVATRSEDLLVLKDIMRPGEAPDSSMGNWLPVPVPVVNPTLGTGLLGALLYLHPKDSVDEPAATSGVGALYTDSESWFVGVFHDDYWLEDRLRFKTMIGSGNFNLDYYGIGDEPNFADNPVSYNASANISMLQLLARIGTKTNWYVGARHTYTSGDVVFQLSEHADGLPDVSSSLTTSSLGAVVTRDSRNDNYYPTGGNYFEAVYSRDSDEWGSDFSYDKYSGFYNHYLQLTDNGTLALRGDISTVSGDAPFYMVPTLKMRGFASGKYRNDVAASGHVEWRHKFHSRWAYIAFFEFGSAADSLSAAIEGDVIRSVGGGVRWQVLESKSLNLGLDVGFSGDDKAVYIQVGERF